jgi:hypothetical protein
MKTSLESTSFRYLMTTKKNATTAFILSLLFGSYGMLYSTVNGAMIMFLIHGLMICFTGGAGLFISWPLGAMWAAMAAKRNDAF